MRKRIAHTVFAILFLAMIVWLSGCQTDLRGGLSFKAFQKGENGGEVWKSRGFSWGNLENGSN